MSSSESDHQSKVLRLGILSHKILGGNNSSTVRCASSRRGHFIRLVVFENQKYREQKRDTGMISQHSQIHDSYRKKNRRTKGRTHISTKLQAIAMTHVVNGCSV